MSTEQRLYHGGPSGLRDRILPPTVTGAAGDQLGVRSWVCLSTDLRLARYFAAGRARLAGRPFGTVYVVEPDGDLEPDIDAPWSWRAPSAAIAGVAIHVRAADAAALERWFRRWAPGAFTASDRALGLTEWREWAKRGGVPYCLPEDWNRAASPRHQPDESKEYA